MRPLIDTNLVSELMRPRPDARVERWAGAQEGFHLSVIACEEIVFGLAWQPRPAKSAWFDSFLRRHCVLLPVTAEIARLAGEMRGRLAAIGQVRHQADLLIAATARIAGVPLATRNTADFSDCGIVVLNPFADG